MFKKNNNNATKDATALNSAATHGFVELSDDQLENCTGGVFVHFDLGQSNGRWIFNVRNGDEAADAVWNYFSRITVGSASRTGNVITWDGPQHFFNDGMSWWDGDTRVYVQGPGIKYNDFHYGKEF